MNKYFCPVCWQRVMRSQGSNIRAHFDTASNECEGSGEPYEIALIAPAGSTLRRAVNEARHLLAAVA